MCYRLLTKDLDRVRLSILQKPCQASEWASESTLKYLMFKNSICKTIVMARVQKPFFRLCSREVADRFVSYYKTRLSTTLDNRLNHSYRNFGLHIRRATSMRASRALRAGFGMPRLFAGCPGIMRASWADGCQVRLLHLTLSTTRYFAVFSLRSLLLTNLHRPNDPEIHLIRPLPSQPAQAGGTT